MIYITLTLLCFAHVASTSIIPYDIAEPGMPEDSGELISREEELWPYMDSMGMSTGLPEIYNFST